MYGQKVKLDLDKIKNRSKNEEVVESKPVEEVADEIVEETVEEQAVEEVVEEPVEEETVESEPVEEVVEEEVAESEPVEEVVEEEAVESEPVEEVVEEPVEEKVVEEKSAGDDSKVIDNLKTKLNEREKKLSNQSSELNYLTNKVIPKLKKENAELNRLKKELTDALEKSTRKYFDQLDINADLSNQIGKLGAEGAVNKVRADKLENELGSIEAGKIADMIIVKENPIDKIESLANNDNILTVIQDGRILKHNPIF